MTSLLARLGQSESRLISTTRWPIGKRKRAEWVCHECRGEAASDQRRFLSDQVARQTINTSVPRLLRNERKAPSTREFNGSSPSPLIINGTRAYHTERADDISQPSTRKYGLERDARPLQETEGIWTEMEKSLSADGAVSPGVISRPDPGSSSSRDIRASDIPLLNIDYKATFESALLDRSADTVFRCLLAASEARDFGFVRDISPADFTKAIDILQPCNTIAEFVNVHYELSRARTRVMGAMPLKQIAREFAQALQEIVNMRRQAQAPISLDDYKMLLRGARDLGDLRMATNIWKHLSRDGIAPDTDCYNYYMGAVVWKQGHDASALPARQRVPSASEVVRAEQRRRRGLPHAKFLLGGEFIQEKTMKIFDEMLSAQISPDEQSFILTMLAAAKAGDLSTVKSTLRRVWGVDVDGLMMERNAQRRSREHLVASHGFPPTEALLFAVAHIFGINNDIPTALRTVDHIARRFELVIPQDTWDQLFEWTFAMSTRRTSLREVTEDLREGQLRRRSVLELWNTMTSEPYNVKPTMGMYNRLVRNLLRREWPASMFRYMNEGRELSNASRADAEAKYRAFRDAVKREARKGDTSSGITGRELEEKRRAFEVADLIRSRDHRWLIEWVQMLLKSMPSWLRADEHGDWPLREIPRMLWDWRHVAPARVSYAVHGGNIAFDLHDRRRKKKSMATRKVRLERVRALLDTAPVLVGHDWVFKHGAPQEAPALSAR